MDENVLDFPIALLVDQVPGASGTLDICLLTEWIYAKKIVLTDEGDRG